VSDTIRHLVAVLIHSGSDKALLDALACDAYTALDDRRALDGLGWTPMFLTLAERIAIHDEIARRESAEVRP